MLIGHGIEPSIVVGERVQGALPPVIEDPNLTNMYQKIFA
jgi:hypothetical protein